MLHAHLIPIDSILVVGQLKELERNRFLHPVDPSVRRLWMEVRPVVKLFVHFAYREPLGLHELVPTVVGWEYVKIYGVYVIGIKVVDKD